jgi:OOP family OmpA-OmpF porin
MNSPGSRAASLYRRRILVLGALATFALYVIGAPIFNNAIEGDLEERVPDELADAGFAGVTASFSGQDGTLTCLQPLDDPERAVQAAYDIWGVHAVELDRSCRVNAAPIVATTTLPPATTVPDTVPPSVPAADITVPDSTTTIPPDFATVAEIVASDPQFALLAVLVDEAGLAAPLAEPGDVITLFAPTDAAFDVVSADTIADLRSNPELLARVLSHHAVDGRLGSGDLVDGSVTSLDGGELTIVVDGELIIIDTATIVAPDIAAGNGVVHAIDTVLVPADLDLNAPQPMAEVVVTYADGSITFEGVVASEVERAVLATAAAGLPIDDRLEVDPDVGLDEVTAGQLSQLLTAVRAQLLSGNIRFDGDGLSVSGTYSTDAERDAVLVVAEQVGAETQLEPPPEASDDDAVDLEAELNAFVAENPIRFEPSSAVLSPASAVVIDRVALEAQQFSGVVITVEGHTDSDGDATANLVLSQLRANAVRDALVERGVDPASITATGFGSERPVLVDGVEDKAASRRVEFRVVATP